ncbi:MAG: Fis family transcriptional regulator [Actinomyces sp.]|uniref:Fis family transcriptional regulator n=1 Tax=Actinomyces sp. TaxID=29317 RepID=UPI0026DC1FA4|nr:Fis family transcriptional regulator [Actinomyces sp.]MDO4242278.1 Fis family transcriptional regulator [Actinomyces sp.]
MNWDSLLADLESRFEAERRADLAAQSADLAEAEVSRIRMADRLRGAPGRRVLLRTRSGAHVDGVVVRAEDGFVLVDEGEGLQAIVPVEALAIAGPLPGPAPRGETWRTPTFQGALRELARVGARVRVVLSGGELVGRIVRVGADWFDVVVDAAEAGARKSATAPVDGGVVTVALGAVEAVRSR